MNGKRRYIIQEYLYLDDYEFAEQIEKTDSPVEHEPTMSL